MASTSQPLDRPESPSTHHDTSSVSPNTKSSTSISHHAAINSLPQTLSSASPKPPTLPPSLSPPTPLTISPLTYEKLPTYRRLLALLLPIPYRPSFSTEPLQSPSSPCIALLAHWQPFPSSSSSSSAPSTDLIIGLIQARILPPQENSNSHHPTLYIQALGLLAPYRHLGIATHLLEALLARVRERDAEIKEVWAHVWEASEEALEWYVKRGFSVEEGVVGYYRRLRPGGARVVRMVVRGGGDEQEDNEGG